MGLRALAASDLDTIMQDDVAGFSWPITITDPSESVFSLKGFSSDISALIDPDTGVSVTGRLATCSVSYQALRGAGIATNPKGVSNASQNPWKVTFDDIEGNSYTFKVTRAEPDRAIGCLAMTLEAIE